MYQKGKKKCFLRNQNFRAHFVEKELPPYLGGFAEKVMCDKPLRIHFARCNRLCRGKKGQSLYAISEAFK